MNLNEFLNNNQHNLIKFQHKQIHQII